MRTRRNRSLKRKRQMTYKRYGKKSGKKWVTAIEAAQKTLQKTASLSSANLSFKKQALTNARRLFGSVGTL